MFSTNIYGQPIKEVKELPPSPLLNEDVKLYTTASERETYDNLADLYAIIVSIEQLEKAYIKDSITASEYTPACTKLLAQYKTAFQLISSQFTEMETFYKTYFMNCPAALNRLRIGVPATVEHETGSDLESGKNAKYVAETVQHFITLMDSLKLNMVAVDQLHPLLSDLIQSLNKVSSLPADFEAKVKIKNWLVILNKMKASDEINEEQSRQLLFDLESAHSAFYRSLSK